MKYMGSKARIAKYILPIMLKYWKPDMDFIDAFTGGANIIDKVPNNIERYAFDNNKYLISMLKSVQNGIFGKDNITKDMYSEARNQYNKKERGLNGVYLSDTDLGWIGYMASANGRFFEGGYSGISKTKIGTERNYILESVKGIKSQHPKLKGVNFEVKDFLDINPQKRSIIYCDPPYKGTKQYATSVNFNYDKYYDKLRQLHNYGHMVFCSEYEMPIDFICIWEMELKSSLSANSVCGGNKLSTEKLFIHKSQVTT